ncbi:MAG: fumarate reductase subunit D [Ignavibacteriae bacterium]|nr:fumarate reductase subunit D [Ignavibacteriota bacterium]
MKTRKSIDPFWWSLFGTGGVIAALCLPALLFLNGVAIPLGWIEAPSYEHVLTLVKNSLTRLFLFVVISLSLFHWAHRFRFTLYDGLQLKHLNQLIAVLCYGTAMIGTIASLYTLWGL